MQIAHIKKNQDGTWAEPHPLETHLKETSSLAAKFASEFGNSDWAELTALLHDLGKYHPDWQKYIRKETGYDEDGNLENYNGRPNHSTAGAVYLFEKFRFSPAAKLLAYIIAGHHSGLPNWTAQLHNRLFDENGNLYLDDLDRIRVIDEAKQFLETPIPQSVPSVFNNNSKDNEQLHLWVRILFSCLVDADFLDTEKYMNEKERGGFKNFTELKDRFDKFISQKSGEGDLNNKRKEILNQCREKALLKPGFFSLTVPTGGGKTLSSMAFALEHAIKHSKKRIIVAIPYTSIIEQTSKVYKYGSDDESEIKERINSGNILFGEENVIEHHSNLEPEKETAKNRLACENWDAPIIVTTNVQLFESLLGNKTSVCRKLHNIVNSIIILDEAQLLPTQHFRSILSVLNGLVKYFGVTVLLMSATQPALTGQLGSAPNIIYGLENVREVIDNPVQLSSKFKRVEFIFPKDLNESESWEEISTKILQFNKVLCILNTRSDCRALYKQMPEGTYHLSRYMCGEDISTTLSEIKQRLKYNESLVRVISTQLVEAGVDIDFPVVFRALTGIDSIIQASGRCNRENKLPEKGKTYIFVPPKESPVGYLRKCEDAGKAILRNMSSSEFTPEIYSKYFKELYSNLNTFDSARFSDLLILNSADFTFSFKTFSENFSMIDSLSQVGIIVRYENESTGKDNSPLIDQLEHTGLTKDLARKLQRYIVNVPVYIFNKISESGYIKNINGIWVQCDDNLYRNGYGMVIDEFDLTQGAGVI